MIDLGALQVKVQADTSEAESKLSKFGKTADGATGKNAALGKAASVARKAFVAYAAAMGATYAALKKVLGAIAKEGDEIDKQSQKLNTSAEQYQVLELAAKHCGTSMSTMSRATTKAMGQGYDNIYDYLTELEKIPDASDRMAQAQADLGTKTANELAPLIKGTESLEDYKKELESLGYYSDEAVKNSAAYEDALTSLNQTQMIIKNVIAEKVLPVVTDLIKKVTDFVTTHKPQIQEFFDKVADGINFVVEHIKLIAGIFAGLGITAVILSVVTAIGSVITAIQAILPVLAVLKGAFIALSMNPFVLIIAGIVAVVAGIVLLIKNWDKVKKAFKKALNIAINTKAGQKALELINKLKSIWEKLKKAAKTAASFAIKTPGLQAAITAFGKLKELWNKIKKGGTATYKTTTSGTGGGHRIGLKEVPFDNYNALLHKGETVLTAAETNQLTQALNAGTTNTVATGGVLTTVINLDGKQIYQGTVDYINGQTLQFNASPI